MQKDRLFDDRLIAQLFLLAIASLSFFPFLGTTHLFDWDEINFAESAREMIVTGDFLRVRINYEPFWEKPPLFFWMQVVAMKIFGVSDFAARLPNALFGLITALVLFRIGAKEQSSRFGVIWSLAYMGSLLPHLYFRSGIIDPVFNLFIFLGVYYLYLTVSASGISRKQAVLAGLFTGLAVLTKGPVGFLLVLLTFLAYWVSKRFSRSIAHYQEVLLFALTVFMISAIWFGYETYQNGPWYLVEFIQYQIELFRQPVAGHAQPWYYHFVVVFLGCFPTSIIGLGYLVGSPKGDMSQLNHWFRLLFWVVLLLFTIVTTKIVHYSSLTYLPLSFLAALQLNRWVSGVPIRKLYSILYLFFGIVWSALFVSLGYVLNHIDLVKGLVKGKFAQASLTVEVLAAGWEPLIGLIFLLTVFLTIWLWRRGAQLQAILVHVIGFSVTMTCVAGAVLPKIEAYSQGPAIEFFEKYAESDVYLTTVGYKSYAHYFYGRVDSYDQQEAPAQDWLLSGPIDKPVYLSVKINKEGKMSAYNDARRLYQKGGFVFYERLPLFSQSDQNR
ncbi:MAG: 4-amino-4-deoxy-L-arabinose transferase-like glycosyltransferase [Cyclobacteriaceae bacterium]|jgi:4-amino-4-deoxy-L-arabinose transferase-like glycosyltransferase